MSAYVSLASPMIDQEVLVAALTEVSFDKSQIEVHEKPVPLIGYEGYESEQRAQVVIRKQYVGAVSNDIGFERTPAGFRAHISDYDQSRYGSAWLRRLQDAYSRHDRIKQEGLARAEAADIEARRVAEIEARRRTKERRALIEAQRQTIHEKARSLGYQVEETRQGDKLRLVLAKRVY